MATTTLIEGEPLPWDAFVDSEVDKQTSSSGSLEQRRQSLRLHIDDYREREWPATVRYLARDHDIHIEEGLEPHWVAPGRAVLWQEQIVRRGVTKADEDGRQYRELEEVNGGWQPTSGFPLGNAGQVAYYLRKGLRLRPPLGDVDVEALSLPTSPPPVDQGEPLVVYQCARHTEIFSTTIWKAYLTHCQLRGEVPDQVPPEEERQRVLSMPYYCFQCGRSYRNYKLASRHMFTERRKARPNPNHPTPPQMREYVDRLKAKIKEDQNSEL